MIIVKGKPILEHIIINARNEGFYNFTIIVHYLKKIINYFKDGSKFGVNINYIEEKIPLGTAGGLSLINNKLSKNVIVTNADTMTNISYKGLLSHHTSTNASATIGIKVINTREDYGLVKLNGLKVTKFDEKPILQKHINCGVYVLKKQLLSKLIYNENIDMITFLKKVLKNKKKIFAYPLYENWMDLGNKKKS